MTKKHFIAIAKLLAEAHETARNDSHATAEWATDYIQAGLIDLMIADNPRFDRGQFDAACEPKI